MLLDYAETYPNVIIQYKTSNMVLHVDLDAAYLTMTEARNFYAGHFYLSNWPSPSLIKPNLNTQSVKQSVMLYPQQLRLKHVKPSTMVNQIST